MTAPIREANNAASAGQIAAHLARCDADFVPPLSGRVDIPDYAAKLHRCAVCFESWAQDELVGLLAAYYAAQPGEAYVTSLSVLREWSGRGIAMRLLERCVGEALQRGLTAVSLEVARGHHRALRLYERFGFVAAGERDCRIRMTLPFAQRGSS